MDLARSPAWSPDGRWIAFLSAQKGNFDVIVAEVEIQGEKLIVGNERTLVVDAAADGSSGLSWGQ
jgi:Tol biopolymer transport system component